MLEASVWSTHSHPDSSEMHAELNISFILFHERVYHSCLAALILIMVTAGHREHTVLMAQGGKSTPCLHTTPTTIIPTQSIQREERMWAQLGVFSPTTHQSCLTSPAVPDLLLIILSTVNDSYSATIIPLNVTHVFQHVLSHHWTVAIPATVIPTMDHRHSCLLRECLSRILGLCHFCLLCFSSTLNHCYFCLLDK